MNIVQFWHDQNIPDEIQELITTWKTINKDADHQVFNAESAAEFMLANYPADIAQAFNDITIPAMYCDVFRVAYILKQGGVYVDCGTRCFHPVSEWGINLNALTLMRKWHGGVWNGLISAPASHPWIHELWNNIEGVLKQRKDGDIFSLTGPRLFTAMAEKEAKLAEDDQTYKIPGQDQNTRSIEVISQAELSPHFDLVNQLKHKSRAHWSKLQNVIPLFESEMNSNATIRAGHLTLTIAHSLAGKQGLYDNFKITDSISVHPDPCIELNLDALEEESLISQIFNSENKNIAAFVDLTSCMSETCYKKSDATTSLERLSQLCNHFSSSEIVYSVIDQSAAIAAILSLTNRLDTDTRTDCEKIKSLLASPALDFNLIDEAFRFFFPHSKLKPFHTNTTEVDDFNLIEDVKMLEEINNSFSESNANLFEKYPTLAQMQNNNRYRHSAA